MKLYFIDFKDPFISVVLKPQVKRIRFLRLSGILRNLSSSGQQSQRLITRRIISALDNTLQIFLLIKVQYLDPNSHELALPLRSQRILVFEVILKMPPW